MVGDCLVHMIYKKPRRTTVNDSEQVLNTSDAAATYVTDLSGWVSRHGQFWGADERMARWSGATHIVCGCGTVISKNRLKCEDCHRKAQRTKFRAMATREWDGKTPLCIHDTDTYFFGADDLQDYVDEHETDVTALNLVICTPVYLSEVKPEYWCDDLPEDGEVSDEVLDALDDLNACIKRQKPCAWQPGEHRAVITRASLNKTVFTVEQPTRVNDDGTLFFLRGYSGGFGAEYGARLTREEYEADFIKQLGGGKLVERNGVFTFELIHAPAKSVTKGDGK